MEAFEVGEEVADSFIGAGLPVEEFSRRNVQTGKLHLDLSKANRLQLLQAGVSSTKINEAGLCKHLKSTKGSNIFKYEIGNILI